MLVFFSLRVNYRALLDREVKQASLLAALEQILILLSGQVHTCLREEMLSHSLVFLSHELDTFIAQSVQLHTKVRHTPVIVHADIFIAPVNLIVDLSRHNGT